MTSAHFANSPPTRFNRFGYSNRRSIVPTHNTHSDNSQLNNKSSTSFTAIANSCFSFNTSAITFTLP